MSKSAQRVFLALLVVSGFCGLVYEIVFVKLFTYVFGVTAFAATVVLAAYMGGLAFGSLLLGRAADRTRRPLRLYALLEAAIGLYCVTTPFWYRVIGDVYGMLYHRCGWSLALVTVVRYALCWLFILAPTMLMGGTLPVAVRAVTRLEEEISSRISTLYAVNTLGAAGGTLAAAYLLVPALGLDGAIYLAASLNGLVAITAWWLSRRQTAAAVEPDKLKVVSLEAPTRASEELPWIVLTGAFAAGGLSLAYEVVWTHALAQTIGNSVYAFGTMLFTFLLGIGLGSLALARGQPTRAQVSAWVGVTQWGVAVSVLATLPLWDKVPRIFQLGQTGHWGTAALVLLPGAGLLLAERAWAKSRAPRPDRPPGAGRWLLRWLLVLAIPGAWLARSRLTHSESAGFWVAELVRFLCSVNLMIWPTVFLGATFPLLISAYSARLDRLGSRIGLVYFANTAGAILGSVATGFWLLPWLGTQTLCRVLAVANCLVGTVLVASLVGWSTTWVRRSAVAVTAVVAVLVAALPRWDLTILNSGANVYFDQGRPIDATLYYAEDVQGGVTSVVREGRTRVLLTNGKFEGNDGSEMAAQDDFVHVPMLYARRFDRALVIGLGTGRTLSTLAAYPFRHIDVAELAPHIASAARQFFPQINHDVLADPRVSLHITDGRQWLQVTTNQYDAITIEITSIWFAGAADLYSREFYAAAARRLAPGGVLQQWVQLHHLRQRDLLVIFNTARQVFPHLRFFVSTHQGVLIASQQPLRVDYNAILARQQLAELQPTLSHVKLHNLFTLLGTLILDNQAMNNILTNLVRQPRVSTDFRPYLEYATPRGNFLPYDAWASNVTWLVRYQADPLGDVANVPDQRDHLVLRGLAAIGRGDQTRARAALTAAQALQPTAEVATWLETLGAAQEANHAR